MPPLLLFDLEHVDLRRCVLDRERFYSLMPQRHEFMLIDGVCHLDTERGEMVSFADITTDDWWVRGHVPGRPLLPGVLMLEMAGQSTAVLYKMVTGEHATFVGFGGIDACKFREAVIPPRRLLILCRLEEKRPRRLISETQGVADGRLIFSARVTGLPMP
jgi:3-hydroxyacyl-[acyl-carrier-protein] dehydratase